MQVVTMYVCMEEKGTMKFTPGGAGFYLKYKISLSLSLWDVKGLSPLVIYLVHIVYNFEKDQARTFHLRYLMINLTPSYSLSFVTLIQLLLIIELK